MALVYVAELVRQGGKVLLRTISPFEQASQQSCSSSTPPLFSAGFISKTVVHPLLSSFPFTRKEYYVCSVASRLGSPSSSRRTIVSGIIRHVHMYILTCIWKLLY